MQGFTEIFLYFVWANSAHRSSFLGQNGYQSCLRARRTPFIYASEILFAISSARNLRNAIVLTPKMKGLGIYLVKTLSRKSLPFKFELIVENLGIQERRTCGLLDF